MKIVESLRKPRSSTLSTLPEPDFSTTNNTVLEDGDSSDGSSDYSTTPPRIRVVSSAGVHVVKDSEVYRDGWKREVNEPTFFSNRCYKINPLFNLEKPEGILNGSPDSSSGIDDAPLATLHKPDHRQADSVITVGTQISSSARGSCEIPKSKKGFHMAVPLRTVELEPEVEQAQIMPDAAGMSTCSRSSLKRQTHGRSRPANAGRPSHAAMSRLSISRRSSRRAGDAEARKRGIPRHMSSPPATSPAAAASCALKFQNPLVSCSSCLPHNINAGSDFLSKRFQLLVSCMSKVWLKGSAGCSNLGQDSMPDVRMQRVHANDIDVNEMKVLLDTINRNLKKLENSSRAHPQLLSSKLGPVYFTT